MDEGTDYRGMTRRELLEYRENLQSRLEIHTKRGEIFSEQAVNGDKNYDAFMAEKILAKLAKLTELSGGWALETMEGYQRLTDLANGDPLTLSLSQLGLHERTTECLERYGVLWVRELIEWTPAMIEAVPMFGARVLAEIQFRLSDIGLALRKPAGKEEPQLPDPLLPRPCHNGVKPKNRKPQDREKEAIRLANRQILLWMSEGVPQREISKRLGKSAKSGATASSLARNLRKRLRGGESPQLIAQSMGFKFSSVARDKAIDFLRKLL